MSVSVAIINDKPDHTRKAYVGLSDAYSFFNQKLFANTLPSCLITFQRKKNMRGYYSNDRFYTDEVKTDEIALNPSTFEGRTKEQILSTLVHEMCHLWQHHHGEKKPKSAYHNKEWADKMKEVGLQPSDTGEVGGKEVGQKVTHYIITSGRFADYCEEFLASYELTLYNSLENASGGSKAKRESKTKYTCEMCGVNAWAKPNTKLLCGICESLMEPEPEQ